MRRPVSGTAPALWRAAILVAALAGLAVGAAAEAQVTTRQTRPARAAAGPVPQAPTNPAVPQLPRVVPAFPLEAAAGLCQCISDRTRRNISCLAGTEACQSVCGTTNYSLVPNAVFTCPLAPGEQLTTPAQRLTQ
jgi:hypothetical protein